PPSLRLLTPQVASQRRRTASTSLGMPSRSKIEWTRETTMLRGGLRTWIISAIELWRSGLNEGWYTSLQTSMSGLRRRNLSPFRPFLDVTTASLELESRLEFFWSNRTRSSNALMKPPSPPPPLPVTTPSTSSITTQTGRPALRIFPFSVFDSLPRTFSVP